MPTYDKPPGTHVDPAIWSYTSAAAEVADLRKKIERQYGRNVRETIGRDTPIDRGVYEGTYGGEAIVVDSTKDVMLTDATGEILTLITDPAGHPQKNYALHTVFNYVRDNMPYDQAAVDEIFRDYCQGRDGQKIALDVYIRQHAGVCRHQALFAGALLEGLVKRGVLTGAVSVDRNMVRTKGDEYDGHAWVRYTNSKGTVFILDVAQGRIGPLEDFMQERRAGRDKIWDYARPSDHAALRARIALEAIAAEAHFKTSGSSVKFDSDGLIIVPDSVKNPQDNSDTAGLPSQHERPKVDIAQFKSRRAGILRLIQWSIENAGHNDPSAMASQIGREIDQLASIPGLTDAMKQYLSKNKDVCFEIVRAGRDSRSPYYQNQRLGLKKVANALEAIPIPDES